MYYLVSLVVRSGTVIVGLLLTYVQASTITIAELGYFHIGYALLLGLSTVARYGLGLSLIKLGGELYATSDRRLVLNCFTRGFIYAILFSVACTAIALALFALPGIQRLFNNPPEAAFRLLLLSIPFNSVLAIFGSYLRVVEKPNLAAVFESSGILLVVLLFTYAGIFIDVNLSLTHYALFYAISSSLVFIAALVCFFRDARKVGYRFFDTTNSAYHGASRIFNNIHNFALIDLIAFATYYGIYFIISFLLNAEHIGVFVVAYRISTVFNFIMVAINGITIAQFSKLHSLNKKHELHELCNRSLAFALLIGTPLLTIITLFHSPVLAVFDIASNNASAGLILLILSFGQFFGLFSGSAGTLVSMSDCQHRLRKITMFALALSLFLTAILAYFYGIIGAALGVTIAFIVRSIRIYMLSREIFGFNVIPRFN